MESYCFLFPTDESNASLGRLQRFIQCIDGFQVAELDLQIRGSGELLGKKQSGQVEFFFADLADTGFIEQVNLVVKTFLQENSLDEFPLLHAHIQRLNEQVHLE